MANTQRKRFAARPNNIPGDRGTPGSGRVSRAGFSLVEMAMVLLTLSILFSLMFGFFFGVSQIAGQESPLSTQKYAALTALANIRSSLNQTFYHKEVKRLVFVGKKVQSGEYDRYRLTFSAAHRGAEQTGTPGVREVSFYVREEPEARDGTGTLIRREDQLVDAYPGQGGLHYPLLRNVYSLQFLYSLDGKKWEEKWHHGDRKRIPRLIRISLEAKIGSRRERFETMAYPGLYHN